MVESIEKLHEKEINISYERVWEDLSVDQLKNKKKKLFTASVVDNTEPYPTDITSNTYVIGTNISMLQQPSFDRRGKVFATLEITNSKENKSSFLNQTSIFH